MSVQATSWVWEYSKSDGAARLVLLAIADAANREGQRSYQSATSLARMTGVSSRSVWRAIAELESLGEIRKSGIHGEHGTTVYELPGLADKDSSRANLSRDNLARRDKTDTPGVPNQDSGVPVHGTQPHKNLKETPYKRATRITADFRPTPELIAWAKDKAPLVNLQLETEQFIDHWTAASGKTASKLDWPAAWRTWIRNQQKWTAEKNPQTAPNGFNPNDWMNQ